MEITMETTTSVQAPQKTSIASAVPLISRVLMPSDSADSSTSMLYKHRETGGCKPLTFYYTVPHAVCHPAYHTWLGVLGCLWSSYQYLCITRRSSLLHRHGHVCGKSLRR